MTTKQEKPAGSRGMTILDGTTAIFIADVTMSEQHDFDARITDYPVERGSDYSEHIQAMPWSLRTAIHLAAGTNSDDAARRRRGIEALRFLRSLQERARLVTIVSSMDVYTNMGLAAGSLPRNAALGSALKIDLRWKEVKLSELTTTAIPASILEATVRASAKGKDERKDQAKEEEAATKEAREKTLFKSLKDGILG